MSDGKHTERDAFAAGMSATGRFQDHPDGTLATDMTLRQARGLAYTMPDPERPCVVRCSDGVLLCAPSRTGARDLHLKARGWYADVNPDTGTLVAWRKAKPPKPGAWNASVRQARDEMLFRVESLPPQAVLGVVARRGGGGIDEVALVLSPSADDGAEALALAGGDIEAGGRTFLVDTFRGSVPRGFSPVPTGDDPAPGTPDPSEAAARAGELPPREPEAEE